MKARDYIPALKFGAKIMPEDIAGMIGLPYVGNIFYVDPNAGSDSANSGNAQNDALATVAAAYAKCTSGKHDVVLIVPSGGTGRTAETAAITWAKRFTHLIGNAAPNGSMTRAGMAFTGTSLSPCLNITENGCIFKNITIYTAVATNLILVNMTGDYNYFENVHFAGIGHATAADDGTARCLVLTTSSENKFVGCKFGIDTVTRSAGSLLEQTGACANNRYVDCDFSTYADGAGAFWVTLNGTECYNKFVEFDGCRFNNPTPANATAMTAGFNTNGLGGGTIKLLNSTTQGCTALSTNYVHFYHNIPVFDTAAPGLMTVAS